MAKKTRILIEEGSLWYLCFLSRQKKLLGLPLSLLIGKFVLANSQERSGLFFINLYSWGKKASHSHLILFFSKSWQFFLPSFVFEQKQLTGERKGKCVAGFYSHFASLSLHLLGGGGRHAVTALLYCTDLLFAKVLTVMQSGQWEKDECESIIIVSKNTISSRILFSAFSKANELNGDPFSPPKSWEDPFPKFSVEIFFFKKSLNSSFRLLVFYRRLLPCSLGALTYLNCSTTWRNPYGLAAAVQRSLPPLGPMQISV